MLVTGLVAFATFRFVVLAEQREVGEVMIECLLIELHDIGIPTFVVGVTGGATSIARLGRQAMKTGASVNVGCDVFVTVETQCSLFGTLELRMTGAAFFLVFRMTFDDLTGHDQRLNLGIGSFGYHARKSHNYPGQKKKRSHTISITAASTCAPPTHVLTPTRPSRRR